MIEAMSVALDAALEAVGEKGLEAYVLQHLIAGDVIGIKVSSGVNRKELLKTVRRWVFVGDNGDACRTITVNTEPNDYFYRWSAYENVDVLVNDMIAIVENDAAQYREARRYVFKAFTDRGGAGAAEPLYFARYVTTVRAQYAP